MKFKTDNPTHEMILAARNASGLSQGGAAAVIGLSHYQRWAEYERGAQAIDPIRWQWFLLRTGQHPKFELTEVA